MPMSWLRLCLHGLMASGTILSLWPRTTNAHELVAGTLTIEHPWVAATRPGIDKTAGFVIGIKNSADSEERLIGASIEGVKPGTIRQKVSAGGGGTYAPLPEGVVIPAHGETGLMPGQTQIYFEGLPYALQEGHVVEGTLIFAKAGSVAVEYRIEPADLASEDSASSSESKEMDKTGHMHHAH